MKRRSLLSLAIVCFLQTLSAQTLPAQALKNDLKAPDHNFCAHDWAMQQALSSAHTNLLQRQIEQQVYAYFSKKKGWANLLAPAEGLPSPPPYTLPVVVHIIHDGGSENIPDAQVLQGIQDLNDAYANVGYYDPTTGVDTRIQFCLAKRDPGGNATTGINRVQTPLTDMTLETDDLPVKDLSRWDPEHYINIWIVREICSISYGCGVAGYAYFPASHGQPEDGIMMEAEYFGSNQANSGVQIHEMGHYLGLYHTFQGGCSNSDCLADGDRVCDTPPDQTTAWIPCSSTSNSCSTDANSGFSSDQNDLFQDYMDYSDLNCYSVFTDGQRDRMHWHIENVRFSLLESQGCLDPCTSALTASFTSSQTTLDAGGTVNFTNSSTNTTSAGWEIDGVAFANSTNASYTFNSVGTFEICLYVGNADPNCSDRFCQNITVTCPVSASFTASNLYPEPGQPVSYSNTSNATTFSEWSVNGVVQANSTDFNFTYPSAGVYTVCLIAGNGLCTAEYCLPVFVANPPPPPSDCDSTFLKIYGTPQDDEIGHALAVVPDALGGGFLIGGGKADSAMLTLLNPAGNIVWTRAFDATFDAADYIWDISFDSDNNVIGSGQTRDEPLGNVECFAFKYNMVTNTMLWVNELDLNDPAVEAYYSIFEKTPGGNYVVAGTVTPPGNPVTGCDGIILELNRNTGANVWQRNYTLGSCESFQRTILHNNNIYTTGRYNFDGGGTARMRPGITKFDLNGNQLWSRLYLRGVTPSTNARLYSSDVVSDNGLVVLGQGDNNGTSTTDVSIFLFRTDYDGNLEWAMEYDIAGASSETTTRLVNLPDGYLCLGYFTQGDQDVFIFKTDKQGNLVWSKSYGSTGSEDGFDMLWENGLIYFTGQSDGIGTSGTEDLFLATLTANGEPTAQDNCNLFADLPMTATPYQNPYDAQHDLTNLNQTWNQFLQTAIMGETAVQATVACGGPCAEVCDNGLDDDGDGYVDCFDPDCPCNTDDCTANPADLEQNFATQLAWQSTVNEVSVDATPIIANLNPLVDSIPEIIVIESKASITAQLSSNLLIFKGDGSNAANPKKLPVTSGYDGYSAVNPAVGDVDGNGVPEVVMISADRRIRVYSNYDENAAVPMQEIVVSSDLVDDRNRKPFLADFNGDGISEVYVGDDVFMFNFSGTPTLTKVLNGGGSAGLLFYNSYQEPNCSPVAVDILQPVHCNGDPDCNGLELVAGNIIYSVDLVTSDGDGFEIKVQRNLNTLQSQFNYLDGYTSVADVDLDGILDVVVSSGRNNAEGIYVWNRNGLVEWFQHPPFMNPGRSGGLPCIANVYDDTQSGAAVDFPEIIVCSDFHLNCYNVNAAAQGQPLKAWWSLPTTDASGLTGATVFDFNGDGIEEIIYRDEDNLRIMYGGAAPFPAGVDAQRNWDTFTAGSGTFDEHPVVADVDNDGQANLIVTSYTFAGTNTPPADYRGRLRVFEADLTAGDPWLSARPIWNQYNYFVVNVNDDLSLPIQQQLHHLEFPAVGSQYRPFNKYLAQTPLLDNDFQPYLPVPDATVSVDSVGCGSDSVLLVLKICNEGDAQLPDETPIAFYLSDPLTTAATLHFMAFLEQNIPPSGCHVQPVNIPATLAASVFVVMNDDGTAATPYNFGTDFPVTNILECNYLNNPASAPLQFTAPTLDLGPDTTMCQFGIVVLDAGPGFATYDWSDGSEEQTTTIFNPGTYWVEVTDSCGGVQTDTISIVVDSATVLELGDDISLCSGGSYMFDVSGFDQYEWTPGDGLSCTDCPNPTAAPAASITYTLVASTLAGCVSADSVSITVFPAFASYDTIEICEGQSVVLFGDTITMAGVYSDTLTTADGCDSISTVTVTVLPGISTSEAINICFGETTIIFGMPTGTAGVYEMTFPGANGCDSTHTITLTVGDEILIDFQLENAACFGGNDGSATVSASGGAGNFTYEWENGETTATLDGLAAGTYNVTVMDGDGCTASGEVTIGQPAAVEVAITAMDISCTQLGSATADASGGTPPYAFEWNTGDVAQAISDLMAGSYSVTATDDNGCTGSASVSINGALGPNVVITVDEPVTSADPDGGALSIAINGGMAPFQVEWSNGETTTSINDLSSGTYTATVTDVNGCTATASANLFVGGCIGDRIWNDLDRDGCQDAGEPGMGNIGLTLTGTDIFGNAISMTASTALNGQYLFGNVPPGTYQVAVDVPTDYLLSPANACSNDFNDSDFNQNGSMGGIALAEGQCITTVDGGLYDDCLNITTPGQICCDQTICGPGADPAPIVSVVPAGGGAGQTMYMWMYSHQSGPFNAGSWTVVTGANGLPITTASFDPGPVSQTTYFTRCAIAAGCEQWLESNIVAVFVDSVAVAEINGPDVVCVGTTTTYFATQNQPGATYSWNFGPWATPSTSNQATANVTFGQTGVTQISLTVSRNGCTSVEDWQITVTSNPSLCSNPLIGPGSDVPGAGRAMAFSNSQDFTVWPNPVGDLLNVAWGEPFDADLKLEILGVEGRVLWRGTAAAGDVSFGADMSQLPAGVYCLKLVTGDGEKAVFKVIKQ
ncbi:MAG: T9SS type A sorting domain-containing protein [Saprospiraceae bacterium]|nr:T9SS type A sorting domain-containing protein [Saprospiraceae bacterium]